MSLLKIIVVLGQLVEKEAKWSLFIDLLITITRNVLYRLRFIEV